MGKGKVLSVRMDEELYNLLERIAKREVRSMSQQVVYYLQQAIQQEESPEQPSLFGREEGNEREENSA